MKKLSQHIKQALAALAAADAGEMLPRRDMAAYLIDRDDLTADDAPPQRQVALWMGGAHHAEALAYALSTCRRLQAGLTVLLPGAPLPLADQNQIRQGLAGAGLIWRQVTLEGDLKTVLPDYIRVHPQVIFLVVSAEDAATLDFAQRQGGLGVPLVMVTRDPEQNHDAHLPGLATVAL
jgi:hypothetical protein